MAEAITVPVGGKAQEASQLATSAMVTTVFEQILAAVHTGELLPGQRISDAALAQQLGVSRTPVREALLRLREIGIIEASAGRFTRVADVTPLQTAQAFVVWLALYDALLDEVLPGLDGSVADEMAADHVTFVSSIDTLDAQALATANFWFFQRLLPASRNPALQRGITAVVHIVRLGSLHLPAFLDVEALADSQQLLLEAIRRRDLPAAHTALATLRRIEIPQG